MRSFQRGRKRPVEVGEPDVTPSSPLGLLLLRRWADGSLSATDVQEIALAAMKTPRDARDLSALANLGAMGHQKGNCERDLKRKFFKDVSMPEPYMLKTTVFGKQKDGKKEKMQCDFPILFPHLWIRALEEAEMWDVLGPPNEVSKFWKSQSLKNPRLAKCRRYLEGCGDWRHQGPLPLCLHGDAAPHTEMDGLMVVSMRSICSSMPVNLSQMVLLVAPKYMITPEMWVDVWDVLTWSLEAMALGTMPLAGPKGTPLPQHDVVGKPFKRAMIYAVTGDLEFFYTEFNFPRHNAMNPCPWCSCNQSDQPWNDFRPGARWREGLVSVEALMANTHHKLFTVPGLHPLALHLDTLHTLDLGVSCHVAGNVLWELVGQRPEAQELAMRKLNLLIQQTYEALGTPVNQRVSSIGLKDLRKAGKEYPILKHQKGAKVRHFIPVLERLCAKWQAEDHDRHRYKVVQGLLEIYESLEKRDYCWSRVGWQAFDKAVCKMLINYQWLAKEAFQKRETLWSVVQKHHMTCHLPQQAQWVNPRYVWTYGSESYMGTMVKLASACLHGTQAKGVPPKMIAKWRFFWHLLVRRIVDLEDD